MSTSTLLVTGASGDIGRDVINRALSQGKTVVASIRNKAHIATFTAHKNLYFLLMAMDKPESIRQAFTELDTLLAGQPLDGVIHCAAIEAPATVEFTDAEALEQVLKINTIGTLVLMQQSFPRMRNSGGNIVLASSLWGRVSGPMVSSYSASKWALESLADAARRETAGMGFNISLVNIGAVKSRMLDSHIEDVHKLLQQAEAEERALYGHAYTEHAEMTTKFNALAISVEKVSRKLLQIVNRRNPKPRYAVGIDARVLILLNWLLPNRLLDALLGIGKPRSSTR